MARDFEMEYYGLLHVLKELAVDLRKIRDTVLDQQTIDRHIMLIDHEVAKGAKPCKTS